MISREMKYKRLKKTGLCGKIRGQRMISSPISRPIATGLEKVAIIIPSLEIR